MNQIQLDCLIQLVRQGSVLAASKELFLTPQAVWKYLSNLEKELGVNLFVKGTHELTRAGKYYYVIFEENSRILNQTKDRVRLHYEELKRNLKIGVSEWMDHLGEIDNIISSFSNDHPDINMSIQKYTNNDMLEKLSGNELDVAIISSQHFNNDTNISSVIIGSESLCFYVSRNSIDDVDMNRPEECYGLPYIWSPPWPVNWLIQEHLQMTDMKKIGITPKQTIILKNMQSVCAELELSTGCFLAGKRHSVCKKIPGIMEIPIPHEVNTLCLYNGGNENPLINPFIKTAKKILSDK